METTLAAAAGGGPSTIQSVLVALAVLLPTAYLCGQIARRAGQPAVMGEIVGGVALGPSLLGLLPGNPTEVLFPPEIRPILQALAQIGLVLFMFGVGYHLNLYGHRVGRKVAVISLSSVALPFTLGAGLAVAFHHLLDTGEGLPGLLGPALFLGAAMSITAFPVLARIITEHGLNRRPVGQLALACAAVEDLLAWTALAVVVVVVNADSPWRLGGMALEIAAFVLLMYFAVRPALAWLLSPERRWAATGGITHTVLITGLLLSAFTTEFIGLHAVFGAFAFGAVVPRLLVEAQHPEVPDQIEHTSLLLLPVFFTLTGLSVNIGGLGVDGVIMVVAVIVVAVVSKFVAASSAARLTGSDWREARVLGVLINARGLTELVILNVGLSLGVLNSQIFTAMVIMALVTTLMTGPLLRRLLTPEERGEPAPALPAGAGSVAGAGPQP
ncbi:cation:proton antiporter [Micromonospora endolithica]|uniref:Cation/H(+) antiporter n=1 Tax=Micromonospora endolithica TaxID=230091 RepID=A0A3A9ZGM4_9ACTN|nr:cation:proton antiporter [Micromonospora endolithica]RKN47503.1 cation/H(+) antiporter [Micromonospora endolithica]TWJ21138.1 transporter, CPA2 family (TC 2.A.37) [Micromonospora endolithica]